MALIKKKEIININLILTKNVIFQYIKPDTNTNITSTYGLNSIRNTSQVVIKVVLKRKRKDSLKNWALMIQFNSSIH